MQDTMDAIIFEKIGKTKLEKRPIPHPKTPTDAVVKVLIASICGSDLHMLSDPPGFPGRQGVICGHELIGEVIETGSGVASVRVGQRVIIDPNVPCGSCFFCKSGMPNMCESLDLIGFFSDGAFAQYMMCDEKVMIPLEESVPLERAMFAEPINCVYGAIKKIKLIAGESVLVLGAGPIGLLFAQLLLANGAGKVFVSETSSLRREYAKKIGVTKCFNPMECNLEEAVKAETGGLGVNVTVDAVGVLIGDGLTCTRPGGRILLFGQNFAKTETISQNLITRKALSVMGNYIGDYTLPAVGMVLESGIIQPEKLISHRFDLAHFEEGLNIMRRGEAMKVAIYPWGLPEGLA